MQTVQVRISIPKRLFVCLREMLCQRRMSVQAYFEELASSDTEMIRNQKCRANSLLPSGAKTATIETTDDDNHRTKLRPAQIKRLLHLRSEGVSTADIAVRFGLSRNRITSLFADYDKREHTPSAVQPGPSRKRGPALHVAEASRHA